MSAEQKLIAELREVIDAYPLTTGSVAAILELKRRINVYDRVVDNCTPDVIAAPTVRALMAVAVNAEGKWYACGSDCNSDRESARHAEEMLDASPPILVSFVENTSKALQCVTLDGFIQTVEKQSAQQLSAADSQWVS